MAEERNEIEDKEQWPIDADGIFTIDKRYKKQEKRTLEHYDGETVYLQEQTDYIIEPRDNVSGIATAKSVYEKRTGILNFKNFVGRSKLCGIDIEVESKKIEKGDFDELLKDITKRIASLPFSFNSPTYLPFDRIEMMDDDILYHNFVYLKYIMFQIEEHLRLPALINRITKNPAEKVYRQQTEKNIQKSRKVKPSTIRNMVMSTKNLSKIESTNPLASTSLGKKIGEISISDQHYFPSKIQDSIILKSIDTPENQFVKYFIKTCRLINREFKERIFEEKREKILDAELGDHIKEIDETLSQKENQGFLKEVSQMTIFPTNSTILHQRSGYREIMEHFSKMNLATQFLIDKKNLKSIIEGKDIATLYEYWTYFTLADILRDKVGKVTRADILSESDEKGKHLKRDIEIEYLQGVKLYYNKTYSPSKNTSYSLPMRPDISLETKNGLYIFDAKFKMYDNDIKDIKNAKDKESEDKKLDDRELEENASFTFKHGDIYKMHTYKDSIKNVKSAVMLYPGTEFCMFLEGGKELIRIEDIKDTKISDLCGVGAIPLSPKKDGVEREAILSAFIEKIV